MTSRASLNNFHPALNLYRYSVKRTMGLTVLITVFLLLVCPGYVLMLINNEFKYDFSENATQIYNFDGISSALILIVTVVTTAAALLYLFINFAFLYGRSSSDFFHSLPLKRRGLLFSRFFASIAPLIIPIALTYASMCGILSLDNVDGSFKKVLWGFIFNLLIMLACSAFSMIFIVCAGSIFDLIISFFSFNVGMIFVQLIIFALCREFLRGFPSGSVNDFLYISTPFYYSFAKCFEILADDIVSGGDSLILIAKLPVITVISLIVSYLLYNNRKSEKSGVAYAYKFIYLLCGIIVGIIGSYGLGMIFSDGSYNAVFWIFAVIGGLLSAVTFGAINDRGFKTVKKSLVIGACSVASVAAVSVLLWSGGLGYTSRIPSVDTIDSVQVIFSRCECDVVFKDPSLPVKFHKEIIATDTADSDEYYIYDDYYGDNIYINYTLKNGKVFRREFYVSNENLNTMLEIFKSRENIESMKKELEGLDLSNLTISVYGDDDDYIESAFITSAELKKIAEAYISDIPNATETVLTGSYNLNLEIRGINSKNEYIYRSFYIEEGFKNTLDVINSLDLKSRVTPTDMEE